MYNENEIRGGYLLDAMEQIHLGGDSYTAPQALIHYHPHISREVASRDLEELVRQGLLRMDEARVYSAKVFAAECVAAENLAHRLNDNSRPWNHPIQCDGDLCAEQLDAVAMGLNLGISLVLGGAGSGKTTMIRNLVQSYTAGEEGAVLLLAPTGKAATNLRIKTGFPAYTIHSALGLRQEDEQGITWQDWASIGLLVVDEVSMMTTQMLAGVLDHCPKNCRIVLVGDPNQLQSVGAGNVIPDLLEIGVPFLVLRENHRQEDGQTALRWNVHNFSRLSSAQELALDDSFVFLHVSYFQVPRIVAEEASPRYRDGESVQILTTVNRTGPTSVEELNQELHPMVNPYQPDAPFLHNGTDYFWSGDRVLVTQNLWDIGCCNGDVGTIRVYPMEAEFAVAALDLPDGRSCYFHSQRELSYLRHGYALTVHKSQGSEYDTILLPVTWEMRHMLNRNLLYTAISRTRKQVILVGDWEALEYAMATDAPARKSGLVERTNLRLAA